jgi:hypothetical protein
VKLLWFFVSRKPIAHIHGACDEFIKNWDFAIIAVAQRSCSLQMCYIYCTAHHKEATSAVAAEACGLRG